MKTATGKWIMLVKYQHIRLWYWWTFKLKKDEFSSHISYLSIYNKHKANANEIALKQRHLAHELDAGVPISAFDSDFIKKAKLELF